MAVAIVIKIDGRDKIETNTPALSGEAVAEALRRAVGLDYWADRIASNVWNVRDLRGRIVGYAATDEVINGVRA